VYRTWRGGCNKKSGRPWFFSQGSRPRGFPCGIRGSHRVPA